MEGYGDCVLCKVDDSCFSVWYSVTDNCYNVPYRTVFSIVVLTCKFAVFPCPFQLSSRNIFCFLLVIVFVMLVGLMRATVLVL